jgi:hypothetical protein
MPKGHHRVIVAGRKAAADRTPFPTGLPLRGAASSHPGLEHSTGMKEAIGNNKRAAVLSCAMPADFAVNLI